MGRTPPSGKKSSIDVSGPLDMAIMMDEDLHRQWLEIHRDDPSEVWTRRKDAIKTESNLPLRCWDLLNAIPDHALRNQRLDEFLDMTPDELQEFAQ
jgi:hypothetical protein